MLLLSLLACKLPTQEILPPPEWSADCDGWECPGATTVSWGDTWASCEWECTTLEDGNGVDVFVSLSQDYDGCWSVDSQSVTERDCSWVSY